MRQEMIAFIVSALAIMLLDNSHAIKLYPSITDQLHFITFFAVISLFGGRVCMDAGRNRPGTILCHLRSVAEPPMADIKPCLQTNRAHMVR